MLTWICHGRVGSGFNPGQGSLVQLHKLAAPLSGNQLTNDRMHRYTEWRIPDGVHINAYGVISNGLSSISCDPSKFVTRSTFFFTEVSKQSILYTHYPQFYSL